MKHILPFLFAASLAAQTITSHIVAEVGHVSAQIMIAHSSSTSASLEYGLTTGYGTNVSMTFTATPPVALAYLINLTPGTTYFYRASVNSGASPVTGSFTTLPASDPIEAPIAPAAVSADVSSPTEPSGTYNADITVAAGCSDLKTILTSQIATLTGSNHQRLIIPAGAECDDRQYLFPARPSHTGWVIVKSSKADTVEFAPPGVRVGPKWAGKYARFVNTMHSNWNHGQSVNTAATTTHCNSGQYSGEDNIYWISPIPQNNSLPILWCSSTKWPAYSGATLVTGASGTTTGPVTLTIVGHSFQRGDVIQVPANSFTSNGATTKYMIGAVTATTITVDRLLKAAAGTFASPANDFSVIPVPVWRQPNHTASANNPSGPCNEGGGTGVPDFHFNTASQASFWCVDATGRDFGSSVGVWQKLTPPVTTGSFEGFTHVTFAANASQYRFVGIEFIAPKVPLPVPSGWFIGHNTAVLDSYNRQFATLNLMQVSGTKIVVDRCWFHVEGDAAPPVRLGRFMTVYASDFAIVNNWMDDAIVWQSNTMNDFEGSSGISHYEGGPGLIENNFIRAGTINYYSENGRGVLVHDLTFRRNHLTKRLEWRKGSPEHAAIWAPLGFGDAFMTTRNDWELKTGLRALVEGNIVEYGWSSWTAGQAFTLTTRRNAITGAFGWGAEAMTSITNEAVAMAAASNIRSEDVVLIQGTGSAYDGMLYKVTTGCDDAACTALNLGGSPSGSASGGTARHVWSSRGIRDVNIRWNRVRHGTDVLRLLSYEAPLSSDVSPPFLRRVALTDNQIYDRNSRSFATGGWHSSNGLFAIGNDNGIRYVYSIGNTEHLTIARNTLRNAMGSLPRMLITNDVANWGLLWKDDLITYTDSSNRIIDSNGTFHSAGLTAKWINGTADTNAICCGMSSMSASNPAGWRWPSAINDVKFHSATDHRLRHDSPYISGGASRASHGGDLGSDQDVLDAKLGKVQNARVLSITSTGATISYLAPDVKPCPVEYSTSATWGTGTRISDGGGARVRNVDLTGLSSGTAYYARVLCAVEQPSLTWTTH